MNHSSTIDSWIAAIFGVAGGSIHLTLLNTTVNFWSFSMRGSGCGRQTCAQLFRKEMEIQKIKKGAIKKKPRMICRY